MSRAKKVDQNQRKIVKELRGIPGVSVTDAHTVSHGFPDIVCGYHKKNYLIEIKNPDVPYAGLTADEKKFKESWCGQYGIAYRTEDVLEIIGLKPPKK